ncbi:MAG: glycosyltransferase [Desulfosalsimonas sp.]
MAAPPKVSIIIPVYNLEKYLRRCLDSVINQTLNEIEIICINDGSMDSSLNILRNYENRDSRIRVINKKNEGQGIARNIGINMAKGKYIGFVDGDDWIETEMYKKMYEIAKNNNSDMQICTIKRVDAEGRPLKIECDYDKYIGKKFKVDSIVFNRFDIAEEIFKISRFAWNKIYKRSFLIKNQIFFSANRYYQDNPFFFIAFFKAERISITRNQFYNYLFKREESTSSKKDKPLALLEVNQEIKQYIDTSNVEIEFAQRFDAYTIRRCASYYYRIHRSYRKQFFDMMKFEFQKIDTKDNPFIDIPKKIFCLSVKATPYSLFKYTNLPIYTLLYIYAKLTGKHNLDL